MITGRETVERVHGSKGSGGGGERRRRRRRRFLCPLSVPLPFHREVLLCRCCPLLLDAVKRIESVGTFWHRKRHADSDSDSPGDVHVQAEGEGDPAVRVPSSSWCGYSLDLPFWCFVSFSAQTTSLSTYVFMADARDLGGVIFLLPKKGTTTLLLIFL